MNLPKLTFAGHSATFIEISGVTVAVDPWLEQNPKCPNDLKHPKRLDLICLTHGHGDHAGQAAALAKELGSTIIATWELALIMIKEGVPEKNVIAMNKGGGIDFKGLRISLTNAFHSSSFDTPSGPIYAGEPVGIIVSDGKRTIYHAGDTCLFSDMKLIGEHYRPDLALVPIGDRFTMGPKEAAKAVELIGCRVAVPIHYGTFDMLTGTAAQFKAACASLDAEVVVLEPGQSYQLS